MSPWSYSSIKTFDQCPKKYYHLRVAEDVQDVPGEAADYGTAVHKAAELYMRDGKPIPKKFEFIKPTLEQLERVKGVRHCEMKLGVRKTDAGEYEPCGFFEDGVWWRGVVDLAIINGRTAVMVDYKTGKSARYADVKQLDLMAGALFVRFPELEKIKSALLFVVSDEVVRKIHVREQTERYLSVFDKELDRLEGAHLSGVWNPKASGLCGWCPVVECPHHIQR